MRNQLENIVAGEAITAPALVYFDGVDGKAYLASAATTDHPAQAIVLVDCTEGGDGQAYFSGEVDYAFGSVSRGTPLYLSATAGAITGTAPTNVQQVGFVLSSTTAMFNFQAFTPGVDGGGGGASYLVYTALLTQSGTDAPVATVLENTIGTITWSYNGGGSYLANSSSLFTADKTWSIASANDTGTPIGTLAFDATQILFYNNVGDGVMFKLSIEIRVYP